ncbi:TRAP transporter substrate-binding protein [Lysinibacillus sp. NPDC097287]|uniref:TRAP transporter substrate-binding protein n=1 Tax=Lysinibacillus sp. NPDC097287 TaxID=3364144 RepID=UPI003823E00F
MRKWLLLLTLTSLAVILVACGEDTTKGNGSTDNGTTGDNAEAAKSYTFKLGHEAAESHIKFKVAEKFAEELEKASDGRMKVDLYPSNQLGKEADMAQQVQSGTLEFAILSNGTMSSISESLNGWFMPYLFEDIKAAEKAVDSAEAKQMMTDLEQKNMIGYGVFFAGQRHIFAKKEINSVEDLKGLKIRIPGSPVFESYYKAINASPASMPLPEVYTSLSTGVIDAVDTDLDAALSQKFYEAVENLTLTGHIIFPEVVIASKTLIDGLNEEDQKLIADTWNEVIKWGIAESISKNENLLNELKDLGVKVTELSNYSEFKEASQKVYDQYSSNEVIKAFIEANQ